MLEYVVIGCAYAFAAALQPGPLQAFLLVRVAADGWRRTLPASLAPVLSDGPIALFVLVVLHRMSAEVGQVLRGLGGIALLYLAASTLRTWRRSREGGVVETQSAPQTLARAVGVNLINPGPYVGWSLVLGPLAIEAWRQSPGQAVALVVAFYVTIVLTLALFILLLGTSSFLGPRGRRGMLLASAAAMAAIGIYQLLSLLP